MIAFFTATKGHFCSLLVSNIFLNPLFRFSTFTVHNSATSNTLTHFSTGESFIPVVHTLRLKASICDFKISFFNSNTFGVKLCSAATMLLHLRFSIYVKRHTAVYFELFFCFLSSVRISLFSYPKVFFNFSLDCTFLSCVYSIAYFSSDFNW